MHLNMFAMLNISDEDIAYAERVLLKDNQHFDEERRVFIKNLDTIDLQAVPGSGKTTALLAKLLILEKYMPFNNNSGILVISHTNAAVDEIRNRIGRFCPKLFSYPNFVGTIQRFVDTFLAIPFYVNQFKAKPYRIDNEIYDEQVEQYYNHTPNLSLKAYLDKQDDGLSFLKKIRLTTKKQLISNLNGTPDTFKLKDPDKPTYKSLLKFKYSLLRKGYLHFDDAYTLAEFQLNIIPHYQILLQKRFQFIFVDEMQDMDSHQHDLLERIFYDGGKSLSFFQRIGDRNQAIFNGSAKLDNIWSQRDNILYLNGSHRINPNLAPIIENLALSPNEIEGRNKNEDGSEIEIKPHIIVFNNTTKLEVIKTYADIINDLQVKGKIPKPAIHKFMAVAWRKEHSDADKLGLTDYWNEYSVVGHKTRIDFKVLKDYLLFFNREKMTLESIRKNILNAFLKILRMENILDPNKRFYSKSKMLFYLKEHNSNDYENFKLHIYRWSIAIIQGKTDDALAFVQGFIPEFLGYFQKEIDKSVAFINGESEINNEEIELTKQSNFYEKHGNKIEIGTVHSAKGQTHSATLYLESFFQGKYESEYLKNLFLNSPIDSTGVHIKQALKMSYVGFSRPTHLLCIAIHEDRFNQEFSEIDRNKWEIVEAEQSP